MALRYYAAYIVTSVFSSTLKMGAVCSYETLRLADKPQTEAMYFSKKLIMRMSSSS
jgi:hypothetical protein